jgi:hypothetical protein
LRRSKALLDALLLLVAAGPLRAQWSPGANPEDVFASQRFDALERDDARVLAARSRNRWGEFHTEEFVRRLHLSLTGAPPGFVVPTQSELDAGTLAWERHSPQSAPAAIARANYLLQRADALERAQKWPASDAMTREARQLLLQVRAASQADPNWHAAWLDIARLQGWEPRQIMDAVEAAADAEPAAAAGADRSRARPALVELLGWPVAVRAVQGVGLQRIGLTADRVQCPAALPGRSPLISS